MSKILCMLAWFGALFLSSLASAQFASELDAESIPLSVDSPGLSLDKRRDAFWLEGSAERALAAGLHDLAYTLAVRAQAASPEDRDSTALDLIAIDALLAQGGWVEAVNRLDALRARPNPPMDAIALRQAMIGFAEADIGKVETALSEVEVAALGVGDAAWYWFLLGWTQDRDDDAGESTESFERARLLAAERSPAFAAQIEYLVFRSRLEMQTADAETVTQLQDALAENQGREIRFAFAQQLAVTLFDSGEAEEAIELIDAQLEAIPPELGLERAQFLLLQSMAAGLERNEGRQALQELLFANRFPALMSIALQQAFSKARHENTSDQAWLESVLDGMIGAPREHTLLDQALYYRAVFKFLEADYVGAEEDAGSLQRRFPSSPYRRGVLALQASSAWNRERYRTAASYLQRMRSEFLDLGDSSSLSALIADCYLRAGLRSNTVEDFRNAAEAYTTALSELRDGGQGGPLLFQLVMARLRAGQVDQAMTTLDDPQWRRLAGGEMIWRAEWLLSKELRRLGLVDDAYDRVRASLALSVADPHLRLRLLWLAVKLSTESGQQEETQYWVDQVEAFVGSAGEENFDDRLVGQVRASCLLSLAEAHFAMQEPEEAVALLERLREGYAGFESAVFSYFAQSRYFSSINRTVEAQQLLVSLADNFPENRLAPLALYEAALNAERRGQDTFLDQANKLLERIVTGYPDSEMVFYARLKQGDLLRKLNKFGSAERVYDLLENEYASRADRFLAQMSMADTLIARSRENPGKFEGAISRYELLMDLPEAPLALRVEAAYKLGQAWRSRGEIERAKQAYWLLYDLAVLEAPRLRVLGNKGRWWLARSLLALAEISKEEGSLDQATEFYSQIVRQRLWGAELAQAQLDLLARDAAN